MGFYLFFCEPAVRLTLTKDQVSGMSTKRCRKNILSTIRTLIVPWLHELILFSSSNDFLDFCLSCIVSSGWHNNQGTGVSEYCNTSPIFSLGPLPLIRVTNMFFVWCGWNLKSTSLCNKIFNLLPLDWSKTSTEMFNTVFNELTPRAFLPVSIASSKNMACCSQLRR